MASLQRRHAGKTAMIQIASHANIGLTLVGVLALITNTRPPETTATMSSSGLRGPGIWGRAISNSFKQGS